MEDDKTEAETAKSAQWRIRKGKPEYPTRIANYVFWAKPNNTILYKSVKMAVVRVNNHHMHGK